MDGFPGIWMNRSACANPFILVPLTELANRKGTTLSALSPCNRLMAKLGTSLHHKKLPAPAQPAYQILSAHRLLHRH